MRIVIAFACLAVALGACQSRLTESDLLDLLRKQGLTVTHRPAVQESAFHWERHINLVLSGEEGYSATRFEATSQADEYCRGQRNGVVIGYWCVSTWRDGSGSVWPKVKALASR